MRIFVIRNGVLRLLYGSLLLIITCLLTVSTGYAVEAGDPNVRFAVIGDYGNASAGVGEVADLVYSWDADLIITVGDNLYGSRNYDQTVGQFYCPFLKDAGIGLYCQGGSSIRNDFYPSMGNHDYLDSGGLTAYLNYFTLPGINDVSNGTSGNERYYDFVRGPVHFFVLDSQGALDSALDEAAQKNWLESGLALSTSPWQIVYFHHAPYSSGVNSSTVLMRWPFASWGADAVISGHNHIYERINANGLAYFVSGLGGTSAYSIDPPIPVSQVRYNSEFGSLLIDATNDEMNFQFINTSGTVIDTYTISEPSSPGIVDAWIENSLDDAEQSLTGETAGTMYVDSSDLEFGSDTGYWGNQAVGLRFQNIAVPRGAQITKAYLEFVADETESTPTVVEIRAEDINDAQEFSTINNDITDRTVTSAFVSWDIPAWDTVNAVHQSPDLSAVVQEVVNRSDWQASNSMAYIITGTGIRTAKSWDGAPESAALLHIEYSTATPVDVPPHAPSGLSASAVSTSQINLSWMDNSDNELGFIIQRSVDSINWRRIGSVGPDTQQFKSKRLLPSTLYYYRVFAYNDTGKSDPSNISSAMTDAPVLMHVTNIDSASITRKKRWKPIVIVTLKDADGNPVSGAKVRGSWSSGVQGSTSCVTHANGSCRIQGNARSGNSSVVFTVTRVDHRIYMYDPESNIMSSITIDKPL